MARSKTYVRPVSIGEGIAEARSALNEKNDCVVRAITNASNGAYTYEEIHALCKEHGRIDGDGMFAKDSWPLLIKLGFELRWICGSTQTAVYQHALAQSMGITTYRRVQGVTLDRARIGLQNGSYVVSMKGHMTCIRKGDVIDNFIQRGGRSVTAVWRFVGKPE